MDFHIIATEMQLVKHRQKANKENWWANFQESLS